MADSSDLPTAHHDDEFAPADHPEATGELPQSVIAADDEPEVRADAPKQESEKADDADDAAGADAIELAPEAQDSEDAELARQREAALLTIFQSTVFGADGQKIGRVGQVYLDDQTQEPNWVTVKTGLFGTKEFFVPLEEASAHERRIDVPYTKQQVVGAPRTEVDQNLSAEEEDALYNYYRVPGRMTEEALAELAEAEASQEQQNEAQAAEPGAEGADEDARLTAPFDFAAKTPKLDSEPLQAQAATAVPETETPVSSGEETSGEATDAPLHVGELLDDDDHSPFERPTDLR